MLDIEPSPVEVLRLKLNLSRAEFAAKLGLGVSTVYMNETGRTGRLSARLLLSLADMGIDCRKIERDFAVWQDRRRGLPRKRQEAQSGG